MKQLKRNRDLSGYHIMFNKVHFKEIDEIAKRGDAFVRYGKRMAEESPVSESQ